MEAELRKNIQEAAKNWNYALRPHAIRHMLAEGFNENDIIDAIKNGKIIEYYIEEDRCLITGTFQISPTIKEALHVVIDYWSESEAIEWVDIVTAYIPRHPFWETPYKRGRRKNEGKIYL